MIQSVYIKNYGASAPAASGWYRPIEWLEQPTIADENVVWELMAVFPGNQNPYTHNCQATGGVTTEFYDDVMSPTPFATYTTNNDIFIDWDDCTATEYNGYRMCWAKIFPTDINANFTAIDFEKSHSTLGNYNSQNLERLISCKATHPMLNSGHNMGGDASKSSMLENVEYRNKFVQNGLAFWIYQCTVLKRIWLENPITFTGSASYAFYGDGLTQPPINMVLKPSEHLQIFRNSSIFNAELDFINSISNTAEFIGAKAYYIKGVNMGSIGALGDVGTATTKRIILDGFKQSFNVSPAGIRGEAQFMELAQSLGTTTTGTITMATAQYASFGGMGSDVDDELFSKGWLVNVV